MVLNPGNKYSSKSETPFMLKTSNKEFVERQKSVFDQLNKLQCNLNPEEQMEVDPHNRVDRPQSSTSTSIGKTKTRSITKHFRGKESIFKVPQDPVNYMRTIPDFKKHPHKWTKYSLADVPDEDMSDKSNTKAALSFLSELKNRSSEDTADVSEEPQKIVFKKVRTSRDPSAPEAKATFRSSKVVMPEYVVGQKIKKGKKSHASKVTGNLQLKLDHLLEDD